MTSLGRRGSSSNMGRRRQMMAAIVMPAGMLRLVPLRLLRSHSLGSEPRCLLLKFLAFSCSGNLPGTLVLNHQASLSQPFLTSSMTKPMLTMMRLHMKTHLGSTPMPRAKAIAKTTNVMIVASYSFVSVLSSALCFHLFFCKKYVPYGSSYMGDALRF